MPPSLWRIRIQKGRRDGGIFGKREEGREGGRAEKNVTWQAKWKSEKNSCEYYLREQSTKPPTINLSTLINRATWQSGFFNLFYSSYQLSICGPGVIETLELNHESVAFPVNIHAGKEGQEHLSNSYPVYKDKIQYSV